MTSPHSLVERGPDRPVHLVHATGTHCCATPSAQLEHADVETFKVLGPQGVKPVAADAWDQVHVDRRRRPVEKPAIALEGSKAGQESDEQADPEGRERQQQHDAGDQVNVDRRAVALIGALFHKWPREVFEPMC